jgi:hypothetical protein
MVRQDMIDEGRSADAGRLLDAPLPTRGATNWLENILHKKPSDVVGENHLGMSDISLGTHKNFYPPTTEIVTE